MSKRISVDMDSDYVDSAMGANGSVEHDGGIESAVRTGSRRTRWAIVTLAMITWAAVSCAVTEDSESVTTSALRALQASQSGSASLGTEIWEVAVCRIPADHDETLYDMSGIRLERSAQWIVDELGEVGDYFSRWSHGRYTVEFVPAARDVVPDVGGARQCVDTAVAQMDSAAHGVLVVADAQHREDRNGGWGRDGEGCHGRCPSMAARTEDSVQAIYIGASDFVAEGPSPLDLVEHELGHALGWPHSRWRVEYDSPVDVMSDSAAGRRGDGKRRHAPGVLAINRYLAGWLDRDPLVLDAGHPASSSIRSDDFLVIAVSESQVITVEIVESSGDNAHLGSSGVVVHLVDWSAHVCTSPDSLVGASEPLCRGAARNHRLIAPDGSMDGVMRPSDHVDVAGVRITLSAFESLSGTSGHTAAIDVAPLSGG